MDLYRINMIVYVAKCKRFDCKLFCLLFDMIFLNCLNNLLFCDKYYCFCDIYSVKPGWNQLSE